ncbi:MAG: hypothetical protein HQL32_17595, partial [Planctomycetes bacterium]|nr:hypothetical protein [Planctomycetota bacterium]
DFTSEEARKTMNLLMDNQFSQAQLGALFLVMRKKTMTSEEFDTFLDAWHTKYPPGKCVPSSLLLGNPFDGKKRSLPMSLFAAIILEQVGHPVFVGGTEGLGPKYGLGGGEVLASLKESCGTKLSLFPKYWDQDELFPFCKEVKEARNQIGLRSFLHTIEKCVNPFGAENAILTLHHQPYIERFVNYAQKNFKCSLLFFGDEGAADLGLRKAHQAIRVRGDQIEESQVDAKDFALEELKSEYSCTMEDCLKFWQKALIEGSSKELNWLKVHVALLLYALGKGSSVESLMDEASSSIETAAKGLNS